MKQFITLAVLATSFSALAEISFYRKMDNRECTITKDKVVNKVVFNDKKLGYETSKSFSGFGYEELAKKAAELSTGRTQALGIVTTVTVDGVTSTLHGDDSKEAFQLILLVGGACK